MTVTKGCAVLLTLALAGVLADAATPPPAPDAAPIVRLKTISSRVSSKGASLVVESSEPVPYVTTRPDPLTVLLDFRNAAIEGVTNKFAVNSKSPITSVAVESAESMGEPVSRVRISLAQPVAHHVRSEKNSVVVDFEKIDARNPPYVMPPASRETTDTLQAAGLTGLGPITALNLQTLAPQQVATAAAQAPVPTPALQQPATAAPPPAQGVSSSSERRYTGTPVSFDFQDADLRAVLRTFHDITGLNIVIDPAVQGTVNVALTDVPWDQALDIILRANKLGYILDGTIVRIAPLASLADEESQRRKLADEQALSGELRVLTRTLSYAKAQDLVALLTKSALSARGNLQVDARTNMLIITDLQDRLTTAEGLIASLDKAQPQVEIEARIVEVSKTFSRQLGVQWGFNGRVNPALGNTTNLAFPNSGALSGGVKLDPQAPSAVGLALGSVNGAFNLDAALSAGEQDGNVRLLSTPRVSTQNNIPAEIKQGVQIPFIVPATLTSPAVTTFKDAVLSLKVTPQITAAGTVIMNIFVDNGSPTQTFGVTTINTQAVTTTVLVNDGQTTVVGGIFSSRNNTDTARTPGLGSIPLLKWLFKRELLEDSNRELLVFITPRIIQ